MKKFFCDKKYLLVAILVLIVSNIATSFFSLRHAGVVQDGFRNNYPLLNPDRELYAQDDLIVNVQPLRDQLNEIGNDHGVSIYFELLNTGANIAVNKDVKMWPASLMKIPIALAVMKKVEDGQWTMDKEFTLMEKDKNSIFGNLYQKQTGTRLTTKEVLDELLINSDNTARNMLVRNLKESEFVRVLEHLGIDYDYKNDEQITAKRYSVFWRALFSSTYLTPENSQKIIEIMTRSSSTDFMGQALPKDVIFSHKIGVLYDENVYADSGIVYVPQRPYIVTVMISGHSEQESKDIMKDISKKIYSYISTYAKE